MAKPKAQVQGARVPPDEACCRYAAVRTGEAQRRSRAFGFAISRRPVPA
ncbi:MAG: hypothetical protein MZV70_64275 [Desulfobacterales bacterium]|nr:hypothetical protein [Desulfobacterales bacterium]